MPEQDRPVSPFDESGKRRPPRKQAQGDALSFDASDLVTYSDEVEREVQAHVEAITAREIARDRRRTKRNAFIRRIVDEAIREGIQIAIQQWNKRKS